MSAIACWAAEAYSTAPAHSSTLLKEGSEMNTCKLMLCQICDYQHHRRSGDRVGLLRRFRRQCSTQYGVGSGIPGRERCTFWVTVQRSCASNRQVNVQNFVSFVKNSGPQGVQVVSYPLPQSTRRAQSSGYGRLRVARYATDRVFEALLDVLCALRG